MQAIQEPPNLLELPQGGRYVTPAVASAQSLVCLQGQLPVHIVLSLEGGVELLIPIDEHVAEKLAALLKPMLKDKS